MLGPADERLAVPLDPVGIDADGRVAPVDVGLEVAEGTTGTGHDVLLGIRLGGWVAGQASLRISYQMDELSEATHR